jgi:hypothetical protein
VAVLLRQGKTVGWLLAAAENYYLRVRFRGSFREAMALPDEALAKSGPVVQWIE